MDSKLRRFVNIADAVRETNPWTANEWLCRPDMVRTQNLLVVRATMNPGGCHPFHYHPHREEVIYVLRGRAEQWVDGEKQILHAGEIAFVPAGTVHGSYNPHDEPLIFLAVLSPAVLPTGDAVDPDPRDVSSEEPWLSRREGLPPCA